MNEPAADSKPRLLIQLGVIACARFFLNVGIRLTYPFLPELARGVGVSLTAVARLVALRSLTGFLSPLFSPLSEYFGRRAILIGVCWVFGFSCFLVVIWPTYWVLGLTLSLIALAKVVYDPAMQAYVGENVPYSQRGKAIAITEIPWAAGLLVGAPAVGWLIQRQGWQAPFVWLGIFGLVMGFALWRALPGGRAPGSSITSLRATWQVLKQHPVIWAAALSVLLVATANDMLLILYGDWMEVRFGLTLTSLGLATGLIGLGEISGEMTIGWAVDRFGKRPVVILAGLLNALMYLLIPHTGASLPLALISLVALFFFLEMEIVGAIPLFTEIVPSARSVVMSFVVAATSLGRALGAWAGPLVAARGGFVLSGQVSALLMVLGVLILALWVRENQENVDMKPLM